MSLRLYNSLTKREEDFTPAHPPAVTMYTCGPTVYGRPHIGNYSSFLMADLLRRWLEVGHGYTVKHVKNITDVGHLLHDADQGDDKVEREAEKEKVHPLEIAKKYTEQYLDDEKALSMLPLEAKFRPRATQYVAQMKTMIEDLLQKGIAYGTDDGIYFDVMKFPQYGDLSGNTLQNLSAGARVEIDVHKHHPADFALWKFCVGLNAHHVLRWPSPVGKKRETFPEGFPGWHIECSAMSRALLGDTIDLHTGGEDNIFPHHECEIAQSESVTGKPFVRMWLHKRRIDLAGEKMSKSLGNVLTIPSIIKKGYSPLDLRYYLLSCHYRTHLKFTWKGMDEAHDARRTIMIWIENKGIGEFAPGPNSHSLSQSEVESFVEEFRNCMDSDLNTSGALGAIFQCIHLVNKSGIPPNEVRDALGKFIDLIRQTFGCFEPEISILDEIQALLDERKAARAAKDFQESDRLRDDIKKLGYEVRDEKTEQRVRKV